MKVQPRSLAESLPGVESSHKTWQGWVDAQLQQMEALVGEATVSFRTKLPSTLHSCMAGLDFHRPAATSRLQGGRGEGR